MSENLNWNPIPCLRRRAFLRETGLGVGSPALASLAGGAEARWRGVLDGMLSHAPRAKRVIHLCMAGGPSHLETFDHKPRLRELDGQAFPESFTKG